jgi:formylglycine-generating enzyme required for sulfatase activity
VDKQPWWPVAVGLGALAVIGGGGGFFWWRNASRAPSPNAAAAASAAAAMKSKLAEHRGSCPEGMVFVPEGTFTMGSPDGEGHADEHPAHPVKLSAFCIGGTEVDVHNYRECVHDKRGDLQCTAPKTFPSCNWGAAARVHHPVNCVDWAQADTYCKWAGGALPTEAQWEYAARGTDNRKFPWGNEPPRANRLNACGTECSEANPERHAMYDKSDKWHETAPVGFFPDGASPFGALDMAGNVYEWVGDWYAPYTAAAAPVQNPTGPATGGAEPLHILRGGTYFSGDPLLVRSTARSPAPGAGAASMGFRCVHAP